VRRRAGFLTGSIGGFINQFRDYIFERELPAKAIPAIANPEGLTPFQFVATDARFIGGEAELTLHLLENQQHRIHLDLSADSVRARETENNTPLPRIPPVRYSARLNYEDGHWQAVIEVRHSARQSRVADTETTTGGSTLINTSVSYLIPTARVTYEFFVRGRNLTNRTVREHTSFLKDFAPQAGRGVIGGIRLSL
jgi:iron complex outermembrane receptor protein